jgi:hypothetical protein
MSLFDEPYDVCHIARRVDLTTTDRNGNHPLRPLPPVNRTCQSLTQFGRRGSSHSILSIEYAQRVETTIHMACSDVSPYQDQDQVLCFGKVEEATGNYIGGIAYVVDGDAADDTHGPLGQEVYSALGFGGTVKLRRVT